MKHLISASIAALIIINLVEILPSSLAPEEKNRLPLQASILNLENSSATSSFSSSVQEEFGASSETALLLNLLELYTEHERDLPKAAAVIDQTQRTETNQKLLELYEAKILSRSLDFEKAAQLLDQINHDELVLLKASVLIALNDRDKVGAYLHQLIEEHPDASIKSAALSLLNIYQKYDMHRDADESYLWTLFAQKLGDFGEFEISHYLSKKATKKNPNYRDAWLIRGYNEIMLKQFEVAETSLLSAYQLDPGNSQIQYLLGITYFELKKPDLSSQYLLYAQQNASQYQEIILEKLAENAILNENYALSAHYYELLLEHEPQQLQALSRLVWLHGEHLNQLEEALRFATLLAEHYPKDANSFQLLSWIYGKMGNLEEATKYLSTAKGLE